MNKHLHRIIFNPARGQRMVVQETASSAGKSASGEGSSSASSSCSARVHTLRPLRLALWSALALSGAMQPLAHAQIIADPSAPGGQRPVILNTANGLPLVNIQTPSAAGVSRNTYSQFDIQRSGAVLNNSRTNVQSQLGGWVQGNPYLATGSARVILNEINSANPTQLRGYLEVAGPRTELIIANPSGIRIDGAGFINTQRVTLTTGVPLVNGGSLDGYRVQRGTIGIDGAGLDNRAVDYTGILARAVEVNAGLWANELKVVAGSNDIDAVQHAVAPTVASHEAPAFALDVSQLGGMYAGKIWLVGTEAGVGVRNAGVIGATSSSLVLQANGWLTNSGLLQGQSDAALTASGVSNSGQVSAGQTLAITTPGTLDNSGGTLRAQRLDISAASLVNRGGAIEQTGSQGLVVQSATLSNAAGGQIGQLPAAGIPGADGTSAGGGTSIIPIAPITPTNPSTTTPPPASSGATDPVVPVVLADGLLAITGALNNDAGRISAAGGLDLASQSGLNNDGGTLRLRQLTVTGGNLSNQGGTLATSGDLRLNTTQIDNRSGHLIAEGELTLAAERIDNQGGEMVQTGTAQTRLWASSALDNTGGRIATNAQKLLINAGALANTDGQIVHAGADTFTLSADTFSGQRGQLTSNGELRANVTGAIDHAGASLTAARVQLQAASLDNQGGHILQTGAGAATLQTSGLLDNRQGLIAANGPVRLDAGALDNTGGTVVAVKDRLDITTTGTLTNNAGHLQAAGELGLSSAALGNHGGTITGRNLTIDTHGASLDNTGGTVAAEGTARLHTGALDNDAGLIQASGILTIDTGGQQLRNTRTAGQGGITSQGSLTLTTGTLDNTQGFIGAKDQLTANTAQFDNAGGVVAGQSGIHVNATGLGNQAGQVQALGDIALATGAGVLDNDAGLLRSAGNITLTAGTLLNTHTLGAQQGIEGDQVSLSAGRIANDGGAIRADRDIALATTGGSTGTGTISNHAGLISAGRMASVQAGDFTNTGGTVLSGQLTRVAARSASGDGRLLSQGDLELMLASDFTNTREVTANGNASITSTGKVTNSGKLQAGGILSVAASDIDNTASGDISSATSRLTANGTLTNRGLIDGQLTRIKAGVVNNLGTGRIYGNQLGIEAGTLNNGSETINGATSAGTIAARERLDIGAATVNNSAGALIFSGGDMAIGGTLDANGRASGQAGLIRNAGATLESQGAMTLEAVRIQNANPSFSYQLTSIAPVSKTDYVAKDGTLRTSDEFGWDSQRLTRLFGAYEAHLDTIGANFFQPIIGAQRPDSPYANPVYKAYYDGPEAFTAAHMGSTGNGDGEMFFYVPDVLVYEQDDPVWALFGLPRPAAPNPGPRPVAHYTHPNDTGVWVEPGAEEITAWEAAAAPWQALQARLEAFRTVANTYMDVFPVYRQYVQTGQQASVTAGSPGQILSGGDMTLDAAQELLNDNSRIIAGGTLRAPGKAIDNQATLITATLSRNGSMTTWGLVSTSCDILGCDDKHGYITVPYAVDIPHTITTGIAVAQGNVPAVPGTGTVPGAAQVGSTSATATPAGPVSAAARNAGIVQVPQTVPGAGAGAGQAPVVRTVAPNAQLPTASLYKLDTSASSHYLVETDPRFASYKHWLGSDYLLSALGLDPSQMQKRLGDGFYEQRLLNEQVMNLTGQRFIGDYTDDDTQYRALMDAGVTFAKAWGLRPGIALTPAQMAQLTSDIVWLVSQTVTLPDGTTQTVLVPQLYVRLKAGDLDGAGTLLAGRSVDLRLSGDLTNTGTIGGRGVVSITAHNIDNLGGRITGRDVSARALNDLNNIGGTLDAGRTLFVEAGHDLNVTSTETSGTGRSGSSTSSYSGIDRLAGLYVTGPGGVLMASSGHDINLTGAVLQSQGTLHVDAGHDLNLNTVSQSDTVSANKGEGNYLRWSQRNDVGSQVTATGDISLVAGHDLNATASTVNSQTGQLYAHGGHDVNINAGSTETSLSTGSQTSGSGWFKSGSTTVRSDASATRAQGSSFGGNTVFIDAGHDLNVTGSQVVSDNGTVLIARNDVTIGNATHTSSQGSYTAHRESGLGLDGGLVIGSQQRSSDQQSRRSTAAASTIGSIDGNVTIRAGNAYTQTGSDVLAPNGNVDIKGKSVKITEARETSSSHSEQQSSQSGLSVSVTSPLLSATQDMGDIGQAIGNTGDGRMQALGVASIGLTGYNASNSLADETGNFSADKAGEVGINLSLGSSKSQSNTSSQSDTARGSTVKGHNVSIQATGGGQDSNLLIQGSDISASGTAKLKADNKVILRASENNAEQSSSHSASSGSIGMSLGTNGGASLNASASQSSGKANGSDTWFSNAHVTGNAVEIESGGDLVMDGAVVEGHRVNAEVGGNLLMGSRQNTSRYTSQQQSNGGSISVSATGVPISGGISVGKTHIDSSYQSVDETTGIKAGDGGFRVDVKGKSVLNGAVITSTDNAVQSGANHYHAAGGTTITDLDNTASYSGSGYKVSANVGFKDDKGRDVLTPGGSAGVGSVDGNASSVTRGGISGMAGDTSVRTGDAPTGIAPVFDAAKAQRDIDGQITTTASFGQQASSAWGNYANQKFVDATSSGDEASAACWAPDGTCRASGHALIGGMTGGAEGMIGGATASFMAPQVASALIESGMPPNVANAIVLTGLLKGGAELAGAQGAASAFNEASNNFVFAAPLIYEAIVTGGAVVAAGCLLSPACTRALASMPGALDSIVEMAGTKESGNASKPSADTYGTPPNGGSPPPEDDNNSKPTRVTNPKHHQNATSPEPKNVDTLYENSIADKSGVRWAKDADGTIHRFSRPSNGETHWNGSTSGSDPIRSQNIPADIKRYFGVK